ncbi:MAG: hypothetical protein LQ346_001611 [Caloplaca aetnensis]|nr:MAG: hypothetical protein LQ346_001611 [Caloplaca aetnensis]
MNAWHALTLDEREVYDRRADCYKAAIATFNAQIPLSPSVSGESSSDSEAEPGGVKDRRAIQRWNQYRKDYGRSSSNSAASCAEATFPFLRLPFDIRRAVYVLMVKRLRPVIQMEPDGSAKHQNGPIDLRIALASKQLHAEVMGAFFEENVIEVNILPDSSIGLPVLFNTKAVSAAYWPLANIKRLHLFVEYNQSEHGNFIRAELAKLCGVLERCTLAQLRITAWSSTKWYKKSFDESFDQVLKGLETLRSVQELDLTEDFDAYCAQGLDNRSCHQIGTKEYREHLRSIVTKPKEATTEGGSNNTEATRN